MPAVDLARLELDPKPTMDKWADLVQLRLETALRAGRAVDGSALAPNAKGYAASKRKKGKPVGFLTGRLLGNVIHPGNVGGRIGGDLSATYRVFVGSSGRDDAKLNAFLKGQKQTTFTKRYTNAKGRVVTEKRSVPRPVPARDFVGLHEDDLDEAAGFMLENVWRQAGFR